MLSGRHGMDTNQKKNMMNHLGPEAEIWFDGVNQQFVGKLKTTFGEDRFNAKSVNLLTEEYEQAVNRLEERNTVFMNLIAETSNFEESIQSGGALIKLDPNETEQQIGMKIKMVLSIADGAEFRVQEEPR